MLHVLADSTLAMWGQIAAIILSIYMLVLLLVGLALSALLMYGSTWVRIKAELVKKLRPTVNSINAAIDTPSSETLPAIVEPDNKLVQAVHAVQSAQVVQMAKAAEKQIGTIEKEVEQGADRVADVVIEIRARTVQAKGILKAFFLPGLTVQKRRDVPLLEATRDSVSASIPGGNSASPAGSSNGDASVH
jgi:DMSO reductase anchor subunit